MSYDNSMRLGRAVVAWLPAIIWMAFIFYLSAQSRPLGEKPSPTFAYVAHLGEYAVLAVLLFWAQLARGSWKGNLALGLALSFLLSAAYAASDEWHQSFVSGRDASPLDFGTDVAGAAVALLVIGRWGQPFLWRQVKYRRIVFPADPKHDRP
jgi:VanZ family protein